MNPLNQFHKPHNPTIEIVGYVSNAHILPIALVRLYRVVNIAHEFIRG